MLSLSAMRLRRSVVFGVSVLLVRFGGASSFGDDDSTPARAKGNGRVTIIYQHDTIQPENRDALKKIIDSGVMSAKFRAMGGEVYVEEE